MSELLVLLLYVQLIFRQTSSANVEADQVTFTVNHWIIIIIMYFSIMTYIEEFLFGDGLSFSFSCGGHKS